MSQVVKATLDEAHPDLPVGEPADERAEQLLRFIDQTLRQVDLTHIHTRLLTPSLSSILEYTVILQLLKPNLSEVVMETQQSL